MGFLHASFQTCLLAGSVLLTLRGASFAVNNPGPVYKSPNGSHSNNTGRC